MKTIWNEFKEFAMKGNVIDLAIGILIGTAFNKIVTSLVNDVIMPFFGLLVGEASFADLTWGTVKYGAFIQTIVDFLIVGFSLFLVVKGFNKVKSLREKEKAEEEEAKDEAELSQQEQLLAEIRDLLKEQKNSMEN
jgi:large conductance mechanosensitive channel